ncbi:MAG: TlpA disulfide reductase family protein [Candidatus Cyclobacteriaceae bacterium M3_2C_046]
MKINITYLNTKWLYFNLFILLLSCDSDKDHQDKSILQGEWRGLLRIQGQQLPFIFELSEEAGQYQVTLINGVERIPIDSVEKDQDSIYIPMHVFDATIVARVIDSTMEGYWIKHYIEDYKVPFRAGYKPKGRFIKPDQETQLNLSGEWAVIFRDGQDSTEAKGIFEQNEDHLTGTFLTPTGDYRFLEGIISGDSIWLSAFNGTSAYLFKAAASQPDILEGTFYSGKTGFSRWKAYRNRQARLPDPNEMTSLVSDQQIHFNFPDLSGQIISSSDEQFRGKPMIIQILGSWCPNCMDETAFLAKWYKQQDKYDISVVGLAFERKNDFSYARKLLTRFKQKYQVTYPILFAGSKEKENLKQAFPMIDQVLAFPTTIFVDSQGNIRQIHTGFSGPGTGKYFEEFKVNFKKMVKKLQES